MARISNTMLVVTNAWPPENDEGIPPETCEVLFGYTKRALTLATIMKLLNKRWKTLDLLSIMREVGRTLPLKATPKYELVDKGKARDGYAVNIFENLSCLPFLQKTEQVSLTKAP